MNHARNRSLDLSLLLLLLAGGCSATDDRPAAWPYISPILFQPNCASTSCHGRAAAVAGLDFSDPDRGYRSLTALTVYVADPDQQTGCQLTDGSIFCEGYSRPLVVAYDPAQSRLVNMLRARGAPRMPPDRPFPEADIELVERWILDGARKIPGGPPAPTASSFPQDDGGKADASDGGADGDGGAEVDGGADGDAGQAVVDAQFADADADADGGNGQ